MKTVSNNQELYDYLLFLIPALRDRGGRAIEQGRDGCSRQRIIHCLRVFRGIWNRIAAVLKDENGVLTQQERDDLLQVVKQIDDAFNGQRK